MADWTLEELAVSFIEVAFGRRSLLSLLPTTTTTTTVPLLLSKATGDWLL